MSAVAIPTLAPAARRRLDELEWGASFGALSEPHYTRLAPSPLPAPYLVAGSADAAALIGLDADAFANPAFAEAFIGNRLPAGCAPLAAVYSGHQFGVWAGQLGDGRALLLGDVDHAGRRHELQLKGAGKTPYSRMGDGRAVLRSSIREFLCSEAMHGLGIPTTRALAVIGSDATVWRETRESTAVVTRMAPSFIRFGSFEHWYSQDRPDLLRELADYTIANFFPELQGLDNPYQALLAEVTRRTARLMAQWQSVGFCHGVMNTDNMSILGLTLDYGPFGFLEAFDAGHICNHTDAQGRYAYQMQPQVAHWNLYCLGQAMLPLIGDVDDTKAALEPFKACYTSAMDHSMHAKLGLREFRPEDGKLIDDLLALMQAGRPDFTLFYRNLGELRLDEPSHDAPVRDLFIDRGAFDAWAVDYRYRLRQEVSRDAERRLAMHAVNPKYVLRNYLAETAIRRAHEKDFSEIDRLLNILRHPYDEQPEHTAYADLPPDWASGLEVSCSS